VLQDSANITYNGVTLTVLAAGVPLFIAATNTNANQLGFSNAANAAPHFYIGTPAVNTLQFANGSGVELARINSTGNIVLNGGNAGADGVGVTFPSTQVASTNANCLDDYEEGTYTPTVSTTGGSITLSASYNTLSYVKVGQLVTITGRVRVSAVSSPTGSLSFTIPFNTSAGTQESGRGECFGVGVEAATVSMNSYLLDFAASSSTVTIFLLSGASYVNAAANITASSIFAFSFSYRCTA
jgi:hypothetical protein